MRHRLNYSKWLIPLLIMFLPLSVSAKTYVLGPETEIGQALSGPKQSFSEQTAWQASDQLYINLDSGENPYYAVKNALSAGAVLLLDGSTVPTPEERETLTSRLIGVGLDAPLLVVAIRDQRLKVEVVTFRLPEGITPPYTGQEAALARIDSQVNQIISELNAEAPL